MTYSELTAAIVNWPDLAGEVDLEGVVDTLVSLAEDSINRELRLAEMLTSRTLDVVDGVVQLPEDCLQVYAVTQDGEQLEPRPTHDVTNGVCDGGGVYAIDGRRLLVPQGDQVTVRYYQTIPPFRTGGPNWLTVRASDLYLYGSLIQAAVFSKEAEQEKGRYQEQYQRIVSALIVRDEEARTPTNQPLRVIYRR